MVQNVRQSWDICEMRHMKRRRIEPNESIINPASVMYANIFLATQSKNLNKNYTQHTSTGNIHTKFIVLPKFALYVHICLCIHK